MATTQEYMDYVLDRIRGPWTVRARKMFGEYMVYLNDKPVVLVCDNTVFVKMRPELRELMEQSPRGLPYAGTGEHYILDLDNGERTAQVLTILEAVTPLPKPRKKPKAKEI